MLCRQFFILHRDGVKPFDAGRGLHALYECTVDYGQEELADIQLVQLPQERLSLLTLIYITDGNEDHMLI